MSSVLRLTARTSSRLFVQNGTSYRCYATNSSQSPIPPRSTNKPNENVKVFSAKSRPPPPSAHSDFNERVEVPRQSFATEQLPRPPPPVSKEQHVETYENPSKPRQYYGARLPPRDTLPLQKKVWPIIAAFVAAGLAGWGAFLLIVTNQEKLSSSVVRQIMRTVRDNEELKDVLGEAIRPQPEWWLNGDPWIEGAINMLQGNIDLSFRLKGHKGSGTLYFTSVRKAKGEPFTILRFRVRGDDGTIVNVPPNSAS